MYKIKNIIFTNEKIRFFLTIQKYFLELIQYVMTS
jgi:hypothetical protein